MTSVKTKSVPVWHLTLLLLLCTTGVACQSEQNASASKSLQKLQIEGPTMGTSYHITVCSDTADVVDKQQIQQDVDQLLKTVNQQMSTYIKTSELSQFNQATADEWLPVSAALVQVVNAGLKLSEDSDGAFDMTVGPLVNLWHFGPDPGKRTIPEKSQIEAARKSVGYHHIQTQHQPPTLKKTIPDVYLDLSAIAKGYAVDEVGEYLESKSIENYLVEIGGEMRSRGINQQGQPWKVGIEKPISEQRVVQHVFPLDNLSMATSGNYRNFFEVDGVSYSHTIDPRTGQPVKHALASVTVVGENCMNCDALATCLMVLGGEEGYNWCAERKIAAYFIVKTETGFRERYSPQWQHIFGEVNEK
ncbi:FAD:protein FMN transferase [Gimesia algae]|uniref:FAD:protein FMN transferase n=1 Tax=Gimesia algae TaxID=2527971 RepID=A0A517VLZ3_9PLAN|nr:FAD:protein FMN transferase [Gimesia algae]QDT94037.1 Thiamine biosynthesis lipoprotein ApbE precursor [Gimesia algae]